MFSQKNNNKCWKKRTTVAKSGTGTWGRGNMGRRDAWECKIGDAGRRDRGRRNVRSGMWEHKIRDAGYIAEKRLKSPWIDRKN